ncbi:MULTISPECIES: PP2C family protein-serine/threonine phosphatase [unclassified Streptomyces]|uniref:PP2C family protein-serine/threonine phosphatase n=1 Tax=unclassified Streptomyces TaxID=2593676 RepID=UPI00037B1EA4|nr:MULTISPECIES: PP2C family protein-serine/threonine phosphatase [unclassified Streptomyces]MYT30876.1 SpoIIE family protein phosphatase [Streptomyces sp. SID8354]
MLRGGGNRTGAVERRVRRDRTAPLGRRLTLRLPVALIVIGLVFDLATPARYTAAPFFAAAPLVAAPLYSLWATAGTALAAVVSDLLLAVYHGVEDYQQSATEVSTVVVVALLALVINRVVRTGEARLASERDVSEAAQRAVLPAPPARLAGLAIAARYVGARAGARIGGDLYAVQDTPHGVRMLVGDVRGKGLEAVEAAVVVVGAFREAAEQEATLEAVAYRLERALQREGGRRAGLEEQEGFATAVLAEIPAGDRSLLRVLNRGHPPPLLLTPEGGLRELVPSTAALPLGLGDLGGRPDRSDETFLPAGALLFLFTDGVTEARDRDGRFYDPCARLRGSWFSGPDDLLDVVVEDVARHTRGGPADDMALVAVQRPLGT